MFVQNFLRDLLKDARKSQDVTEDQLIEYTDTMVRTADRAHVVQLIEYTDTIVSKADRVHRHHGTYS